MRTKLFFVTLMIAAQLQAVTIQAATRIRITVQAGSYDRTDCIVSAEMSALNLSKQATVVLYEKNGNQEQTVPCQLVREEGSVPRLYWVLAGKTKAGESRTFIAVKAKKKTVAKPLMSVEDTQNALILKKGENPILQYHYAFMEPPSGVDQAYGRSGFIHPVYSPGGNVLTTIQPQDHYHHYGIWNPWTRIEYGGQMYDLWNIGDKQGTVKAGTIEQMYAGDVFAGYDASLEHIVFKPDEPLVIMDELWKIKAWNVANGFLWDFESHLYPSTSLPVLLKEYRYAGFGYRATEEWTKDNCEMFTSEGKTRQQIDGTTARWIYITGDTKTGRSGLLFMSHPGNYNAPEPLRIWDENANGGRGDAFINFAPTKNKDWELKPNEHYLLRYRILSYEGEMTREKADRLWDDYAYPPIVVTIEN